MNDKLISVIILTDLPSIAMSAETWSTVAITAEERDWLDHHSDKLTLFFNTEFPPIEFISESGEFIGMGADIIARRVLCS